MSSRRRCGYALAYAGAADCYGMLSFYAFPPRDFVPKAQLMATKALELDAQLPDAHVSLGFLATWFDWDLARAGRHFFAMIAASPGARDAAFGWLEQAYRERSGWLVFLKHDPLADALRTDARFSELLRRVGLKPMSLKNP
jgi:hypothetical protein